MLCTSLEKIGFSVAEVKPFSSHSFSFLCGVPTEIIKLLGNWKSDVFLTHVVFMLETCTAACELMKMRLLALE